MSRIWKRVPQTVRPRSSGRVPVLLCVLVFCLTATTVYRWGRLHWTPVDPNPTYTATAYVVPRGASEDARLPMRHTDGSAKRAAECANALAERYVADRRDEWKHQTEGPYLLAREAADKAQRERAQNTTRLEAFRRQLAEAETAAKARLAARPQVAPLPPMIDNPQWLALDRQLTKLEQRRDEMLVSRTALHPAVQDIGTRILGVQGQLAATPRQIPQGRADVPALPGNQSIAAGVDSQTAIIARADQEKLDALTLAAEKSAQACDDAELAVKKALREQEAGPEFTIESARIVENPPPVDYGWRRLVWTTLLTSILMTFGVGAMSAGAMIEPAAATVAEVQADAGVAMAGMIPADYPLPDVIALSRRQSLLRRAFVALGLILVVVCPMLAIWGVTGISS
jgi:hypothetical protein